jgi:hypothetical protein
MISTMILDELPYHMYLLADTEGRIMVAQEGNVCRMRGVSYPKDFADT